MLPNKVLTINLGEFYDQRRVMAGAENVWEGVGGLGGII